MKAGFHVNKAAYGGIYHGLLAAQQGGATAMQICLSPPVNSHKCTKISLTDRKKIKELVKEHELYLVAHGKYMYNFCKELKWQDDCLIDELVTADQLNIDVIIHQGKNVKDLHLSREQAVKQFAMGVAKVLDRARELKLKSRVILENSCQQGTELGYTIEELATIYYLFSPEQQKQIGFCLDLCHAFVAGALDTRDPKAIQQFFDKFDHLIGLNKLAVIHFNDSKVPFCSCNDHHQMLLIGYAGASPLGGNSKGLQQVVKQANKHNIPMIMETPGNALHQLQLIHAWASEDNDTIEAVESGYLSYYQELILASTSFVKKPKPKPKPKPLKLKLKTKA